MSADRGAAIRKILAEPAAAAFIDKPVPLKRLHSFSGERKGVAPARWRPAPAG